jgi:hypothetical protein
LVFISIKFFKMFQIFMHNKSNIISAILNQGLFSGAHYKKSPKTNITVHITNQKLRTNMGVWKGGRGGSCLIFGQGRPKIACFLIFLRKIVSSIVYRQKEGSCPPLENCCPPLEMSEGAKENQDHIFDFSD